MKTLFTGIFAAALLCGTSLAQDPAPQTDGTAPQSQQAPAATESAPTTPGQESRTPRVAPGSVIPVTLTKTIDAKKAKTGDAVEAKVTQDLKAGNGEVLVPKDTKVLGRVTEAQVRSKEQKESQVGIAFDRAMMKDGEVSLPMSIQAIIAPPNPNNGGNSESEASAQPLPAPGNNGGMPSGGSGRPSGGTPGQIPATPSTIGESPSGATNMHQPITGSTQGVVGFPNLKLAAAPNATDGSLLSSEKSNVKLESGTFMLLRVNQ